MELRLVRESQAEKEGSTHTHGDLYIDGVWECYTLEDPVREIPGRPVSEWKIPGKTAIPYGRYRVVLSRSPRFKKVLPELLKVPGYTGVRIHAGNTAEHTEGCVLVGQRRIKAAVLDSQDAMIELMASLSAVIDYGEQVWITIEEGQ